MNISKTHHKIFLIGLVIVFIGMYVVIFKNTDIKNNSSAPQPLKQNENHLYTSKFLGFKFLLPSGLNVKENGNTIELSNDDTFISITRLFSYFDSEKDYMDYTSKMNNYKYSMKNSGVNNFFIVFNIVHPGSNPNEISYIKNIDTDTFISISTSSPDLYDDLDQIAVSFEYLGDTKE